MAVELAQALVHEVVIDDRQAQRGADSAVRALDRVADASDNAAGAAQRTRTGLLQLDDATAKLSRGQESAWRALDRWKSRTDDAYRANKTLESATRDLDRAIAQGISTEAEKIQILDRLRQQTTRYAAANENAARSTKLAAHEVTNLSYQIQDAAVQLAGGQNPFLILMQQGPQATGAVGGVGRAISLLASPTGLAIAAVGGLVAAFSLVERHAAALREVETFVTLMGGAIGRSADEMEALAGRAAEAGKISVVAAREQEVAYIRAGKLGAESMERLIGLSRDYAVATKQDVGKASEDLAQLFADPVAGAEKLTAAYGLLTGKELERIRVLTATGQAEQARLVLADSLATRTRGLGDQVGTLAVAWERVARAASNAINAIGDATAPETNAQAIARLEERRRQLIAARGLDAGRIAGETGGAAVPNGAVPVDPRYSAPGMATANGELATVNASLAQRYAQRGRDREMAARVGDWQGQVKNSAAADEVARSARPMATEITSLTESITKLESGLKNPGLMAFADDAGRALEGLKNKRADYEAAAAKGIDIETDKRQRLAAVEQKYAGLVGPAAEARKAAEIERINLLGTATTAEERRLAIGAAVTQVTAGQAQAAAQLNVTLSDTANAARLNAEAAGQGEAALRRAAIEAEVYAHRMDGAAGAVRAAREEQEKYARAQIHNEFVRGIDQEIAANNRLIAAYGVSGKAVSEANRYNEAYLQTLKEVAPGEDGWTAALQRNIDKLKERDLSRLNKDISAYADTLRRAKEDISIDRATAGLSDLAAMDVRARYDALKAMGLTIEKYGELDAATRQNVDIQLEGAAAIARQRQEVDNYRDAWETVNSSLGKSFERLGDSLVDAIVQGKDASIDFGSLWKSITASILSDLARLASVDLRRMMGLGGNTQGSLLDLFSSPANQNAANQTGVMGGYGQYAQAGQSVYNAATGTNTLGTMANSFATSSMGYSLGLSSNAVAPGTGIAAGYVDTIGATQISNGVTLTQSGQAVTSGLGAIGQAVPYGALGGMAGAYIGNAAGGNKVVGGLSGAAVGVGSMYAGTAAMGAMGMGAAATAAGASGMAGATAALAAVPVYGWVAAAVLAAVMAIAGTQKPSVGPNAAATMRVENGTLVRKDALADNGANTDSVVRVTDALMQAYNAMGAFGAKLPEGSGYAYIEGGSKVKIHGQGPTDINSLIKQLTASLQADGLVGRALGTDAVRNSTDLNQITKYLAVAKQIEDTTTALSGLDKSLGAVQKAAFKAAGEGLLPMLDELKTANDIGMRSEYMSAVTGQITNLLDDIANPRAYTETEAAVATLTGQLAAWKSVLEQVNPELAKTIDTIQEKGLERINKGVRDTFATNLNEATGKGFLNELADVRKTWDAGATDALKAGVKPEDYVKLYDAQARRIIDGLDDSQIDTVVSYFKDLDPVMAGFAASLRGTTKATREAADAQTAALRQNSDSLRSYLDALGLSDNSSLSPVAKMAEAERQWDAALKKTRETGDVSYATKASDALLSASKPVLVMGTEAYSQREAWVTSTLKNLGHELGLPGFATGGDHLGGLRIVGERGPELEWTGPSRIFSADQTRQILAGATSQAAPNVTVNVDMLPVVQAVSRSTVELKAEISRLRQEVAELKAEQRAGTNFDLVSGRRKAS
ncbi:phage tail length tape measure family protein [Azospirillum brasilense]|nr:phage tail length tape measure family protein [Azospirillum brasilense]